MRPFLTGVLVRLFASLILPFSIVLLALSVAAIDIHGRAMRDLVADRDERSVRAAAAAISQELFHRRIAIRDIALRVADGVPASRAIAQGDVSARDFPLGLAVVTREGRTVAGSLPPLSLSLRETLASQKTKGDASLTSIDRGMVFLAALSQADTAAVGAFAIMDLLRLAFPGLESTGERISAAIIDPRAGILASEGAPLLEADYVKHPGVLAAVRGEYGSSYMSSPTGEEHVLAVSPLGSDGWVLLVEEPWRAVESPLLRLSLLTPLALVPVLAISIIGLWFAARQVVAPLRELQRKSLRLAAGEFEAIEEQVGGVLEIRDLQRSMAVMARRLQSSQRTLKRYVDRVTSTQEEERRKLAQDLHDETIQDLIALDQKVQLADRALRARGRAGSPALRAAHRQAAEAIQRVRRLAQALRPAYLEDLGLLPALEALAADSGSATRMPVVVHTEGSPCELSKQADLAVYRIVQEALTNVARHGAARHVWISLHYRRDEIRLSIRDDGVGFTRPRDAGDLSRDGHFGLIGMEERAKSIGARFELHSAPGNGTRISLRLSLSPQP